MALIMQVVLLTFLRLMSWLGQVETIYVGDRKVSIRTSLLEEKATACNMLCCYVDELKEGFYPYVPEVNHLHLQLSKTKFEICQGISGQM